MAEGDPIKASGAQAVSAAKGRRVKLVRGNRLCREASNDDSKDVEVDRDVMLGKEQQAALDAQTSAAVEELKMLIDDQEEGAMQKKVNALRELRHLLSRSDKPPAEAALKAGVMPVLVHCFSFGVNNSDEQLHEAAWCLTNIVAGMPEEAETILPALPFLITNLAEKKSSGPVAEQFAWALGNVANEDEELRDTLISVGVVLVLARMMFSDKVSTVRSGAWALSNLIKGPNISAANALIKIDGVIDAIIAHFEKEDEDLAIEIAWVVVHLSELSSIATDLMVNNNVVELLVERLTTAKSSKLLIPVLRSLANLVTADADTISTILVAGTQVADKAIAALVKCLKYEHHVLKMEASWVLSEIAASSIEHKKLIFSSEAVPLLLDLLSKRTLHIDTRKEAGYALGNLCVSSPIGAESPVVIKEHLFQLVVKNGCLPKFIDLIRSPDMEAVKLGLQFMELVLIGFPNGDGLIRVKRAKGKDVTEWFQFHQNIEVRKLANRLLSTYFGVQ